MDSKSCRELWEEICFILSKSIPAKMSERDFENQVVRAVEKLGWREYKGEIETQPPMQIGRQSTIRPDVVIYGPNRRALIVIEVKRPEEDIARDETVGQLKSYMLLVKADFGLLIGREIRVFYDGRLNPQSEPLLLDTVDFDDAADAGERFVAIFNREDFIGKKYDRYLQGLIEQFKEKRNIKILRDALISDDTKQKVYDFLKAEFVDYGNDAIESAMEDLGIYLTFDRHETAKPPTPSPPLMHAAIPMYESVFQIICTHDDGATSAAIKERSGLSKKQIGNALWKLRKLGRIGNAERGVYKPIGIHKRSLSPHAVGTAKKTMSKGEISNYEWVFKVISKRKGGVTYAEIKDATDLRDKQIRNTVYRLRKLGRVKSLTPGLYASAETAGSSGVLRQPAPKKSSKTAEPLYESVYKLIKKYKRGITKTAIIEKKGLNYKQASNVLHKLFKLDKIESPTKGSYIAK